MPCGKARANRSAGYSTRNLLGPARLKAFKFKMAENGREFKWTREAKRAAVLVAEGKKTDEQIADACDIGVRTLYRWKDDAQFKAQVALDIEAFRQSVLTTGIADRVNRIKRLDADWQRMQRVIEMRSADTERDVIGAETGLLVRKEKETKFGTQIEYSVDTALLAEIRATEKQAAEELGQWVTRGEIAGKDGGPILITAIKAIEPIFAEGPDGDND